MPTYRTWLSVAVFLAAGATTVAPGRSETISGAISKAYRFNSTLNSARAATRVRDEDVPIAKSGYRPTVTAIIDAEASHDSATRSTVNQASVGLEVNQRIFDGFQTVNNVRAANARVRAQRENLRDTEQNVIIGTVQAYADVILTRQVVALQERNLRFLVEQVRAARSRFEVGEGTRTDVAQAEARRALAIADISRAKADAQSAAATYQQFVGEQPGSLKSPAPIRNGLPSTLERALTIGVEEHPAIGRNKQLVDAAAFTVKSTEGSLKPTLEATARISRDIVGVHGSSSVTRVNEGSSTTAVIGVRLTFPFYQGGLISARVRQDKEILGQARIDVDSAHDQVRQLIMSSWAEFHAAKSSVEANREVVAAAQLALQGAIEERDVGQRTTLDVLDAQEDVITAQINQVRTERDLVVFSYQILFAIGRLSPRQLGLRLAEYQPEEHFKQVEDKWFGLRTPDAR